MLPDSETEAPGFPNSPLNGFDYHLFLEICHNRFNIRLATGRDIQDNGSRLRIDG